MAGADPVPANAAVSTKRKSSGVVVPHAPTWYQRLGAWLVFVLARAVAATLRYRWNDPAGVLENPPPGPVIFCVWHNRLALCMEARRVYARKNRRAGMAAMVSASKDGGFLAGILQCFNVQPVRGSSSRRGPQALLELTTWAERGYDLAITPDGPRGPRYIVQDGVMSLAQLTGLPIVIFSYHAPRKLTFNSWDHFQVPLPFSRCEMAVAKPLWIPRATTDAGREELRKQLEQTLREISRD
jgi:lysophospholipid acyltransferase (LPLAT)-like uncharacterized protein